VQSPGHRPHPWSQPHAARGTCPLFPGLGQKCPPYNLHVEHPLVLQRANSMARNAAPKNRNSSVPKHASNACTTGYRGGRILNHSGRGRDAGLIFHSAFRLDDLGVLCR
jgi:hypothetical protein